MLHVLLTLYLERLGTLESLTDFWDFEQYSSTFNGRSVTVADAVVGICTHAGGKEVL